MMLHVYIKTGRKIAENLQGNYKHRGRKRNILTYDSKGNDRLKVKTTSHRKRLNPTAYVLYIFRAVLHYSEGCQVPVTSRRFSSASLTKTI